MNTWPNRTFVRQQTQLLGQLHRVAETGVEGQRTSSISEAPQEIRARDEHNEQLTPTIADVELQKTCPRPKPQSSE